MKILLGKIQDSFTMGPMHFSILDQDCSKDMPDRKSPDVIEVVTAAGVALRTVKRDGELKSVTVLPTGDKPVVTLITDKLANVAREALAAAEVYLIRE